MYIIERASFLRPCIQTQTTYYFLFPFTLRLLHEPREPSDAISFRLGHHMHDLGRASAAHSNLGLAQDRRVPLGIRRIPLEFRVPVHVQLVLDHARHQPSLLLVEIRRPRVLGNIQALELELAVDAAQEDFFLELVHGPQVRAHVVQQISKRRLLGFDGRRRRRRRRRDLGRPLGPPPLLKVLVALVRHGFGLFLQQAGLARPGRLRVELLAARVDHLVG